MYLKKKDMISCLFENKYLLFSQRWGPKDHFLAYVRYWRWTVNQEFIGFWYFFQLSLIARDFCLQFFQSIQMPLFKIRARIIFFFLFPFIPSLSSSSLPLYGRTHFLSSQSSAARDCLLAANGCQWLTVGIEGLKKLRMLGIERAREMKGVFVVTFVEIPFWFST